MTQTISVTIIVCQGKYEINAYRIEPVKIKGKFERSGNVISGGSIPFSTSQDTEGSADVGSIDLR